MSETAIVMRIFEENPKAAAATASATVGMLNWAIFDPYRHCTAVMSILSATFTYSLITVFMALSALELTDQILKIIAHGAGASGAVLTTVAVFKKLKSTRRRKRIAIRRNGNKNKS